MSSLDRILNARTDIFGNERRRDPNISIASHLSSLAIPEYYHKGDTMNAKLPEVSVHAPHQDCPDSLDCLPDTEDRPQHTLPVILRCAILGAPTKRLTIRDIYFAMEEKYPFYKTAGQTWKQSVRHHLSLNRLFERVPRPPADPGFGSYWTVNLTAPPGTKRPRKRGKPDKDKDGTKKRAKAKKADLQPHEALMNPEHALNSAQKLIHLSSEPNYEANYSQEPPLDPQLRQPPAEVGPSPTVQLSAIQPPSHNVNLGYSKPYGMEEVLVGVSPYVPAHREVRPAQGADSDDDSEDSMESEDEDIMHHHDSMHSPVRYMNGDRDAEPASYALGPAAFSSTHYEPEPFCPPTFSSPSHAPLSRSPAYSLSPVQHQPHPDVHLHMPMDTDFQSLERELDYLRGQLDSVSLESNRLSTQLYEARAEASRLRRLHQVTEQRLREEVSMRQRLDETLQEEVKRRKAAEKQLRDPAIRYAGPPPHHHSR